MTLEVGPSASRCARVRAVGIAVGGGSDGGAVGVAFDAVAVSVVVFFLFILSFASCYLFPDHLLSGTFRNSKQAMAVDRERKAGGSGPRLSSSW